MRGTRKEEEWASRVKKGERKRERGRRRRKGVVLLTKKDGR